VYCVTCTAGGILCRVRIFVGRGVISAELRRKNGSYDGGGGGKPPLKSTELARRVLAPSGPIGAYGELIGAEYAYEEFRYCPCAYPYCIPCGILLCIIYKTRGSGRNRDGIGCWAEWVQIWRVGQGGCYVPAEWYDNPFIRSMFLD
jgi:hypothetical protein